MGRGTFRSQNKVGETMSFQTDSSSTTTFDPTVTFLSGSDRVSWDLGIGNGYIANNSLSYSYPDTGTTKTVTLRTNKLSNLYGGTFNSDNIVGNLNMTGWDNLGGNFLVNSNPLLIGITHTVSTQTFSNYSVNNCNLIGNHDMSMFPNLGGNFDVKKNSNLTGITHTASTQVIHQYSAWRCDLTGNHDLSMFPNLGGNFRIDENSNLTGITHTASTQVFTLYWAYFCDLTGNHDLSMFPNLGGDFRIYQTPNLTGITHTASTQVFTYYGSANCNLIGNHDLSMFPNLGGYFSMQGNSNLTSITHTTSTQVFSTYLAYSCNLTGTHDLSPLQALGGAVIMFTNPNLTDITFPYSTQTFANQTAAATGRALTLNNCNLGYIDFLPLSGATLDVNSLNGASIGLEDNGMSAAEVNLTLFDFYELNNTYSQPGWSGVTLDISGSNAGPDATSGGVDGLTSQTRLVNDYGWTITSN